MSHGLSPATVAKIHEVFGRHPEIEKAVLAEVQTLCKKFPIYPRE